MSVNCRTDDLVSAVRYALETTRAIAVCPFHANVSVRVGDDAAESHACVRASKIITNDGTTWDRQLLLEEIKRQLGDAADGVCPACAPQRIAQPSVGRERRSRVGAVDLPNHGAHGIRWPAGQ
jgi:hypothetical protein